MYKKGISIPFVDMDDTLCDFAGQAYLDLRANPAIRYPQATYGFFRKLRPIKGAIEAMHEMEAMGLNPHILTRPSVLNPMCYTEKRVWVEEHLGLDFCEKLILCPDKSLVGTQDDILIDDFPWEGFRGTQLQFGSPDFSNWDKVMKYIKENYA